MPKIILGDFNAKGGKGKVYNVVGNLDMGEICKQYGMEVVNTSFKQHRRRLYMCTFEERHLKTIHLIYIRRWKNLQ